MTESNRYKFDIALTLEFKAMTVTWLRDSLTRGSD